MAYPAQCVRCGMFKYPGQDVLITNQTLTIILVLYLQDVNLNRQIFIDGDSLFELYEHCFFIFLNVITSITD